MSPADQIMALTEECNRLRRAIDKMGRDRDVFIEHIAMLRQQVEGMRKVDTWAGGINHG